MAFETIKRIAGYGQSAPPQMTQEEQQDENYPVLSGNERALMEAEDKDRAIAIARNNSPDTYLRNSADAVRSVLYDEVPPPNALNGNTNEMFNYFIGRLSKIPSYSKDAKRKLERDLRDTIDCEGVPFMRDFYQKKLVGDMIDVELSISLSDTADRGYSGISSMTVQKQSSDVKLSQTSNNVPDSIFAGLLGKKRA